MSRTPSSPDHEILVRTALDQLAGSEREAIDRWSELAPGEQARLERLDVELLGLLAATLPPERPNPRQRAALLAAAAPQEAPRRPQGLRPAAALRWVLPLAAVLALVAVGTAGRLWVHVQDQRQTLAGLQAEVSALRAQTTRLAASEQGARDRLALVGSRGVAICPLRQRQASPLGGEPFGVLYVAADHQHWYLALHGLLPCPQGRVYQVWFIAPEGPVSAGTFRPEGGGPIELASPTMPEGTHAVRVTLEAAGGAPLPTGPEILFGDQPMQVL